VGVTRPLRITGTSTPMSGVTERLLHGCQPEGTLAGGCGFGPVESFGHDQFRPGGTGDSRSDGFGSVCWLCLSRPDASRSARLLISHRFLGFHGRM